MTSAGGPAVYDDWNRHWSTFGDAVAGNPATAYRSRLILKMLGPLDDDDVILEIGCGQGEFALHLARLYPQAEVRGIDVSREGVRRATLAAASLGLPATFAQRDLMLPAELADDERGRATVAICSEVLEHVDGPDVLLRHAADYLAPGSRLVITVPGGPRSAFDRHIGHRRHFTAARLRHLLETNGFEAGDGPAGRVPVLRPVSTRRHSEGKAPDRRRRAGPRELHSTLVPRGPHCACSIAPSATTSTRPRSAGNWSPRPTASGWSIR